MKTVVLVKGDGIGPEISNAVLTILDKMDLDIDFIEAEMGEKQFLNGYTSGISDSTWEHLREHKTLLKAPISTPSGKGYKSVNVTLRKTLGLYANIRPCKSYHPIIETKHPNMDLIIVRENEEDLYAGVEHRHTQEMRQCLKLISTVGTQKIIKYAFELARLRNRKTVHCFTKDNIMKLTDGLFHQTFKEVSKSYPEINSEHMIIDIGTALLADRPEMFDVIVTPNLYGDIISDVAAQISGSVGLAGSSNIGDNYAMFEAVHGSAPDIAGKNIANPSGFLLAAVNMLSYLGYDKKSVLVYDAWEKTIYDGYHTADIYKENISKECLSTSDFGLAVADRFKYDSAYGSLEMSFPSTVTYVAPKKNLKTLVGVDVFLDYDDYDRKPEILANILKTALVGTNFKLHIITNRGVKVFPNGLDETTCTDHWRCRFMTEENKNITPLHIVTLLTQINNVGLNFVKIENLYCFDGVEGYTLAQGE